jgi:hypothetical protein
MTDDTRKGLIGAALIGLGCGLAAAGAALVVPVCANWSLGLMESAVKRGKDTLSAGVESAASLAGQMSGVAQRKFGEASKTARTRTAKIAGVVENAARQVREHAAS